MAAFDGDNELGPVVVTVVLGTLVAGAFIYGWKRYENGADRIAHSCHRADGAGDRTEPTPVLIVAN